MPLVASWIRENDQRLFAGFVQPHPDVRVGNARVEPVNAREADGLLLTGGCDVSEQYHPAGVSDPSLIQDPDPQRDAWEHAALLVALERGIPIFGICRGVQMLNLGLGGSLFLDIPGHSLPEQRDGNIQPLRHASGIRHVFGSVNSSHHQALDRLGDGLQVEAWSAADGIIEQVRSRGRPFVLGVQYHPERHPMYAPLFEEFFAHVSRTGSSAGHG